LHLVLVKYSGVNFNWANNFSLNIVKARLVTVGRSSCSWIAFSPDYSNFCS